MPLCTGLDSATSPALPPKACPNVFNSNLTVRVLPPLPPIPDMFRLLKLDCGKPGGWHSTEMPSCSYCFSCSRKGQFDNLSGHSVFLHEKWKYICWRIIQAKWWRVLHLWTTAYGSQVSGYILTSGSICFWLERFPDEETLWISWHFTNKCTWGKVSIKGKIEMAPRKLK